MGFQDPLQQFWTLLGDYGLLLVAAVLVFVVLGALKAASKRGGERWGAYGVFGVVAAAGAGILFFAGLANGFGWFLLGIGILFLFVIAYGSRHRGV